MDSILNKQEDGLYAQISMEKGEILCRLDFEKAPLTVANFVGLAEGHYNKIGEGPYFDGLNFHRVELGFVIQGGDPAGNGTGGPGYEFPNEIHSELLHDRAGILSMANAGPDTNGSQFFITLGDASFLDGSYSVFGHVCEGLELVQKVQKGDSMKQVRILRKGAKAEAFRPSWEDFQAMIKKIDEKKHAAQGEVRETLLEHMSKTWPGKEIHHDDNGLSYIILEEGQGPSGSEAGAAEYSMHYTLWVPQKDGSMAKLDSSIDRGEPLSIRPEQVVKGWGLSLPQMCVGEKRALLIPGELGYGKRGSPPVIPPNSYLLFEMQTMSFK